MDWSHLVKKCLLKHVNEGKIEGRLEVTGIRGRRRKQLLNDLKEDYMEVKEKALDHSLWRTRFGRGCGPVIRETTAWMIEYSSNIECHLNWFIFSCYVHSYTVYRQLRLWESVTNLGHFTSRNNLHHQPPAYFELITINTRRNQCIYYIFNGF